MAANWTCADAVLYHRNGTVLVNLVRARENLTPTKGVLETYAAFIVSRIGPALMFSFKAFVQANVANITMERSVSMDSTDTAFFAVERIFINGRVMATS